MLALARFPQNPYRALEPYLTLLELQGEEAGLSGAFWLEAIGGLELLKLSSNYLLLHNNICEI